MFNQSMHNSNYPIDCGFSSSKKKATTPALLFFKSHKDPGSKALTQNNASVLNTNRSPMRGSNAKNNGIISRSPLLNKSGLIGSENKSNGSFIFSQSRRMEQTCQQQIPVQESVHCCENHETRAATFLCANENGDAEYYCQKCAILMASQGFQVEKITDSFEISNSSQLQGSRSMMRNSMLSQKSSRGNLLANSRSIQQSRNNYPLRNSRNNREAEIENFLQMTKGLLDQIEFKKDEIKQNLIRSEEFYGEQIQEINDYFELVYKSLELQKNKCYNYILNQRIQVEKPVRLINETISDLKTKIQGIIDDIQENIETVFQTADEIYRPVIQQYQENYTDISKKIAQIQVFEVEMRKIDFQGVPDSIFSISDILKDSFEQSLHYEHQINLNNQLHSLKQSLRESLPQLQPRKLFSKKNEQSQDLQNKSNNKFCFSFEGEALQAQMQLQRRFEQ